MTSEGNQSQTAIGQREMTYQVMGSGPPVVLIHGASGNHRDMIMALGDALADRFTVIAFDRPGLGMSDAADPPESLSAQARLMRSALKELGHEQAIVLGHSYGGAVALAWALDAPETVKGLVLLSAVSHPWPTPIDRLYRITNTPVLGWLFSQIVPLVASTGNRVDQGIINVFAPDPAPANYRTVVVPEIIATPHRYRINAAQIGALKSQVREMAPKYATLKMPIEVLHGTADTIVGQSTHVPPFLASVPHARFTELPGAGHMPHHSRKDDVVAAITRLAN